jgi:hypothetical protein
MKTKQFSKHFDCRQRFRFAKSELEKILRKEAYSSSNLVCCEGGGGEALETSLQDKFAVFGFDLKKSFRKIAEVEVAHWPERLMAVKITFLRSQ